jgi:hypothetical protein
MLRNRSFWEKIVGNETEDDVGAVGSGVKFLHEVVDHVCEDFTVRYRCHCGFRIVLSLLWRDWTLFEG